MSQLTFGSLFAGIGGFDLGFERAGMRCEWQVEIDQFCQQVLRKHWPNVRRWDDVRTFPPDGDWSVDVICGGFPCQDISNAGKRAGIDGERSGLWSEFARIIRVLRPRIVVVENVAALLQRGFGRVLGDLAESGFDVEWSVLSACGVGAPHTRERVFVVAYSDGAARDRQQRGWFQWAPSRDSEWNLHDQWTFNEPPRMADGIPNRVDRNRAIGNAVVPQVAEWIGRRIIEAVNQEPVEVRKEV